MASSIYYKKKIVHQHDDGSMMEKTTTSIPRQMNYNVWTYGNNEQFNKKNMNCEILKKKLNFGGVNNNNGARKCSNNYWQHQQELQLRHTLPQMVPERRVEKRKKSDLTTIAVVSKEYLQVANNVSAKKTEDTPALFCKRRIVESSSGPVERQSTIVPKSVENKTDNNAHSYEEMPKLRRIKDVLAPIAGRGVSSSIDIIRSQKFVATSKPTTPSTSSLSAATFSKLPLQNCRQSVIQSLPSSPTALTASAATPKTSNTQTRRSSCSSISDKLNSHPNIPKGKLFFIRETNRFLRYFDDSQEELFLTNFKYGLNLGEHGEIIYVPNAKQLFSLKDNLSLEEYIVEMQHVEKNAPVDFFLFYKFVTGYQIYNNNLPVSFLTFLKIYNTNGLKHLLNKYVQTYYKNC